VGAGPAGLTCAAELARRGIRVTVFEAREQPGGVLSHTIPLYRFPDATIAGDAAWATEKGVALKLGARVRSIDALARRFDAVFVAPGTTVQAADVPGSDLRGVWNAGAFLELCRRRRYRNRVGKQVVVIGGGNVAIDASLAVLRCGMQRQTPPRVHLLYRRTRSEMPAWDREVREAEELGVVVHFLVAPVAFAGERGRLRGVTLRRMALAARDASGRPAPEPIPGSDFLVPCDQAILATGMQIAPGSWPELPRTRRGLLRAHPKTKRVRGLLFAGGDATGQEMTVVAAVRDGKLAAEQIARELGDSR
jgi:formate dehydrogenase beta subunit